MKLFTISLFLLIFSSSAFESSKKLNFPRVLLPIFQKISIEFTLEVTEKGCFKWISSRNDLIQISPIYSDDDNECSYKATVTVLTKEKRRNTAIVLAEDIENKDVLRCDVILDVIHKLDVLTTTRELYLEEAPETFELMAEDPQGNVFTALEGVEFDWRIISQNNKISINNNDSDNWRRVLRFLPFTESKYHEIPKSLQKFESLGIKGYMVLLEGVNTGTAKVSVRLPYSEYKHVPAIEVDIMVLANIILDPSDVHMMMGDTVDFRILQLKQGKLYEISLLDQYYLEIEDERIATVSGNKVTSKMFGQTLVILRDRNVPIFTSVGGSATATSDSTIKSLTPKAILVVTKPKKIGINLLPHYNWITVEGEKHEIAIDLYTRDDQKLWLGSKYKIKSQFDATLFYVLNKSENGSRIYGETVKEGLTSVVGTFEELTAVAEMKIYKELIIKPKSVIVPFDPEQTKNYKIKFTAEGGDGYYQWSSLNPNFLYISQNGIAEIKMESIDSLTLQQQQHQHQHQQKYIDDIDESALIAHTFVKVALKYNPRIFRIADLFFLKPIKLEIIKYNFETALDDFVYMHIGLYANINHTLIPFTSCGNLNFDFEFTNPIFDISLVKDTLSTSSSASSLPSSSTEKETLAPKACHLIKLRAVNLGMTYLRISYKYMDITLKDGVTLNVFKKLNILDPLSNEIILPIGSSRNIIYINGPQKMYNIEADLIKNINYDKTITKIYEMTSDNSLVPINAQIDNSISKSTYAFTVLCKKIGETQFEFEVYNSLLFKNIVPYKIKFLTNIHCVKPRFLNLYPKEKLKKTCPFELTKSLMHLNDKKEKTIEIEIEVLDSKNRKLMNITSLIIDWQFKYDIDDKLHKNNICYRHAENNIIERIKIPYKDFLICSIVDIKSDFKVKGTITGYDENVLGMYHIKPEIPNFGIKKTSDGQFYKPVITNEINFMTVNTLIFPFESISILLSSQKERIPITQGSGYYDFKISEQGIISVDFDEKTKELTITPIHVGNVQIELFDRCLMTEPVFLFVYVVTIGSIKVDMLDRVQHFKSIEAVLKIYDSNGDLLKIDHKHLNAYELHYDIMNPAILNIRLSNQDLQNENEIRYIITGIELGDTKIIFYSGYGDRMVSSEPKNIQVFSQLRLYPRNSTLVIGSSVQIYYQGGPHPDTNIVYTIQNQNIISIDSALVTAKKLGETKIIGKCVGNDPVTGKQIVFSEDSVEIYVVPLEKIHVKAPLTRMKCGSIMPVTIWGIPDLSPMVLGTLESLRIIWSTNQPDVIDIFGIFSDIGVDYNEKDLISVRVNAINPGKAKIQATVILSNDKKLSSFVEIIVFKNLELESPKKIVMNSILIAPKSTINLKANIDDVTYRLDDFSSTTINITSDGIVKSSEALGRNLIIANTYGQNLPIDITVKNIHYILATVQYPSVKLRNIEEKIPKGMRIKLKISMYDNLGNEFSHNIEDLNAIKYEMSQKDIFDIQIGNNLTILMNVNSEMDNMIVFSLKDHNGIKCAEDFIKIIASESKNVFPTKTIFSVGDVICFDLPLVPSNYWTDSDSKVLSVDKKTGLTRILGVKYKSTEKVTIMNGDEFGTYMRHDIEIREANEIKFLEANSKMIGNNHNSHLVIRNNLDTDKSTNLIAKNSTKCLNLINSNVKDIKLFTCRLRIKDDIAQQISKHIYTSPIFDSEKGLYACKIELEIILSDIMNIVKKSDINMELEAQLSNGYSDTTAIQILPGIKVNPTSTEQILQKGITIEGLEKILQKVEVESSDSSKMKVVLYKKTPNSILCTIKLKTCEFKDDELFVIVNSLMTSQIIEIPIDSSFLVQNCAKEPFITLPEVIVNLTSYFGYFLFHIVIGLLIIYAISFALGRRNRRRKKKSKLWGKELSPVPFRTPSLENLLASDSAEALNSQSSSIIHDDNDSLLSSELSYGSNDSMRSQEFHRRK